MARCCRLVVRLHGKCVDLIVGCLCSSNLAKVHGSNTGTWWVKQKMGCLSLQLLNKQASTTPSNMVGLQTIFAQILFSNELLSLSITYISELEALLKLVCSSQNLHMARLSTGYFSFRLLVFLRSWRSLPTLDKARTVPFPSATLQGSLSSLGVCNQRFLLNKFC